MRQSIFYAIALSGGLARRVAAQELKDVRPPVNLPSDFFLMYLLLALAVLVSILWFLRRFIPRFPRQRQPERDVSRPAWVTAYERLEQLRRDDLPRQDRMADYYVRLSDIVRRYMEERFFIKAPEMTTEEFLISLQKSPHLQSRQQRSLKDFLTCCDMVKFARYASNLRETEESYALARRLVDETVPAAAIEGEGAARDPGLKTGRD
jgi:hypothetical protein